MEKVIESWEGDGQGTVMPLLSNVVCELENSGATMAGYSGLRDIREFRDFIEHKSLSCRKLGFPWKGR